MPQKLPVYGFKRVENASQFNKVFIENYNEDSDTGYFLQVFYFILFSSLKDTKIQYNI